MKTMIEAVLLVLMAAGVIGGIWNRLRLNKGIGSLFVQYLGLVVLVPLVALLSLENRISTEMIGAIAAAAVGGVLAKVGKDD